MIKEIFVGRRILQPIFERLFRISLRGMNYGLGGLLETSGEKNLISNIKRRLERMGVHSYILIDVGANNGSYTKLLKEQFSSSDQIYCFEPSQFSFEKLEKEFKEIDNISLINKGLGSNEGKMKLFYDNEGSGWASVYKREDTGFNHYLNKSEDIDIITLDGFCSKQKIEKIHFMKIDVEGFEMEVLKGASKILSNTLFIQFEFSFANFNSRTYLFEFFEILNDFKIYRVLRDGIYEIKYDPRYEVLMTTNYLAIHKSLV